MNAPKRGLHVQTPGVVPAPVDTEADADALLRESPDLDEGGSQPPRSNNDMLTVTRGEIQAMIAAAVGKALAPRPPRQEADLPDQSQVDPRTIERPTLSRQGWVVPLKYGEPADPSIKR
jgi:hypothetical protein